MFRCYSYTIIREGIIECLLKLQLLKYSITIHRNEVNTHIVINYIPNICSHTTTVLTTHRCILMDYFNNNNFSKHKSMRSLMMV